MENPARIPQLSRVLQPLDGNTAVGSRSKALVVANVQRLPYKRPLEEHSEEDLAQLTKVQLKDICRSFPKKLKVTGSLQELRDICVNVLRALKSGGSLEDLPKTRKRNGTGDVDGSKENVEPASDAAIKSQGAKQSSLSLNITSKKSKKANRSVCPANEHYWSFKRGLCVVCEQPKPPELVVQQPSTAQTLCNQEETSLVEKLEGLQPHGFKFVGSGMLLLKTSRP
jgi:hypothetical protein